MPTVNVNEDGRYLYYEDSGAPAHSKDYTTVFFLHGFIVHTPIFRRLFPHAASHNLRLIAITVRGYPNSSSLSDSEMAVLTSTNTKEIADIQFLLTKEIALVMAHIIKTERMPVPVQVAGVKSGGAVIVAWSAGAAFLLRLLANFTLLDEDLQIILKEHVTSAILHDPPCLAYGIFKPPNTYSPLEDPTKPFAELGPSFSPWISGNFEPLPDLESITASALEQRKDMIEISLDTKYAPSSSRMTREELEAATYPNIIMRNPTPFSPNIVLEVYAPALRHALFDTKGAWKELGILATWTDMGAVYCPWAARGLYDQLNEPARDGEQRRDVKILKLENANHFIHYEDPERMLRIIADNTRGCQLEGIDTF